MPKTRRTHQCSAPPDFGAGALDIALLASVSRALRIDGSGAATRRVDPRIEEAPRSMQRVDGTLFFSPSDLNHFVECEHLTTLDLLAVEGHGVAKEKDPQAEIIRAKGFEHEQAWLEHLRERGAADRRDCRRRRRRLAPRRGANRSGDARRRRGDLSGGVRRRALAGHRGLPGPRGHALRARRLELRSRGREARASSRSRTSSCSSAGTPSSSRGCRASRRAACTSSSAPARRVDYAPSDFLAVLPRGPRERFLPARCASAAADAIHRRSGTARVRLRLALRAAARRR